MQGDSAERSAQMVAAIRLELENQGWQAGQTRIAFQVCDDSIAETGEWDDRGAATTPPTTPTTPT